MADGNEPRRVEAIPRLPTRRPDAHKGDFGRVLVIAGSRGMAGAAAIVGASALRSGAGLVRVACPAEVQPTVAGFEPCYMTWPLPQDEDGCVDLTSGFGQIQRLVEEADVVAFGPGLGRSGTVGAMVSWLLDVVAVPMVVDADALNVLAGSGVERLLTRPVPTVITPHPGEFARLTGLETAAIQSDRERHAVAFARRARGDAFVVLLKGHGTVVTDGRRVFLNTNGNPGMATGGMGDCLTGVIAAVLGQGMAAFEAASLGAYIHGLAGDIARDQNGEVGLIAGDVVDSLPDAFHLHGDEG